MARALLFTSTLDSMYWQEAIQAAVYIYNITPHYSLKESPFKTLYKKDPNLNNLKIWGSIAYYKDKTNSLTKLEPRARQAILVGYNQYNYYVLDIKTKKIIQVRDVIILEGRFWPNNKNKNRTITINIEDLNNTHDNYNTTINSDSENSLDDILEDNQNTHLDYNLDNTLDDDSENNLEVNNQQSCRTRSRASSIDELATYVPDTTTKRTSSSVYDTRSKRAHLDLEESEDELALITNSTRLEPATYKEAINLVDSKK